MNNSSHTEKIQGIYVFLVPNKISIPKCKYPFTPHKHYTLTHLEKVISKSKSQYHE